MLFPISTLLQPRYLKYIGYLILLLSAIFALYRIYDHIYDKGYAAAIEECNTKLLIKEAEAADRLKELENSSDKIVKDSIAVERAKTAQYKKLLDNLKATPVFNNTECKISKEYLDLYNSAVRAVNNE